MQVQDSICSECGLRFSGSEARHVRSVGHLKAIQRIKQAFDVTQTVQCQCGMIVSRSQVGVHVKGKTHKEYMFYLSNGYFKCQLCRLPYIDEGHLLTKKHRQASADYQRHLDNIKSCQMKDVFKKQRCQILAETGKKFFAYNERSLQCVKQQMEPIKLFLESKQPKIDLRMPLNLSNLQSIGQGIQQSEVRGRLDSSIVRVGVMVPFQAQPPTQNAIKVPNRLVASSLLNLNRLSRWYFFNQVHYIHWSDQETIQKGLHIINQIIQQIRSLNDGLIFLTGRNGQDRVKKISQMTAARMQQERRRMESLSAEGTELAFLNNYVLPSEPLQYPEFVTSGMDVTIIPNNNQFECQLCNQTFGPGNLVLQHPCDVRHSICLDCGKKHYSISKKCPFCRHDFTIPSRPAVLIEHPFDQMTFAEFITTYSESIRNQLLAHHNINPDNENSDSVTETQILSEEVKEQDEMENQIENSISSQPSHQSTEIDY